ncbi:hypothetical protein TRFO_38599 [Tritrichomonas foetus]|uniref:DNA primase large subunit C-terminal domain-containing protein n=1 Tax=Tritrichomonas foetus TaxID=1144522 RepID=A0A1J4JD25_9EUKA|nr:hypothetical protein TRFO_38599 [Tritrichomonas foetus]|eukprot:OHS95309.1 hypothetical protein TRFO_38599 [Tritrichomonas foetus]
MLDSHLFVAQSRFFNAPPGPIQKSFASTNFYTPTYEEAPTQSLDFQELLRLAHRRKAFHKRITFESERGALDFMTLRSLSVDFGIPFKRSEASFAYEVATDHASFYALLFASLANEDDMLRFVSDESRLLYYRLRTSAVSASQIESYFWPSHHANVVVIEGFMNYNHEIEKLYHIKNSNNGNKFDFKIDFIDEFSGNEENDRAIIQFNEALCIFKPHELFLYKGHAIICLDDVHKLASRVFRHNLLKMMKEMIEIGNAKEISFALNEELYKLECKRNNLTLSDLLVRATRSFPPCMIRVINATIKNGKATFKGRLELSLFMKALGLDYYDQHRFWQSALLTRNGGFFDDWRFELQVVQVLKQIYGLDDAECEYAPHRCSTIINHDKPGDNPHIIQGCPFNCLNKAELKVFLKKMRRGASHADIEIISRFATEKPQEACREFFNKCFQTLPLNVNEIETPPFYFFESERRISNS